jgi:hypothetical protein
MARTSLTKTTLLGPWPSLQPAANALDVTFTAADVANKNQFSASGDDLILVWNTDGANPYTFTVTSVVDDKNRTGDITTYSLAAGEVGAFRVRNDGWRQTDGKIYLEGSNAAIKFAVIAL